MNFLRYSGWGNRSTRTPLAASSSCADIKLQTKNVRFESRELRARLSVRLVCLLVIEADYTAIGFQHLDAGTDFHVAPRRRYRADRIGIDAPYLNIKKTVRSPQTLGNLKFPRLFAFPESLPASISEPAAVDGKRMAIDEAALRGISKKCDGGGDIVRRGEAAHRHPSCYVIVRVQPGGLRGNVHRSFHPAGTYCIHTDASSAPFGGQCAGQTDQPVFAGVVSGAIRYAQKTRYRGDIYYAAAALFEHKHAYFAA